MTIALLLRSQSLRCALPIAHVVEVCRPLATTALENEVDFVLGAARHRGDWIPIVDLGRLLSKEGSREHSRLVVVRTFRGRVGLLVDEVYGVSDLGEQVRDLPPLLSRAADSLHVALAEVDREFCAVLDASLIISDENWGKFEDDFRSCAPS